MNRLLLVAALSVVLGTAAAAPYTYHGTLNAQGAPLDGTIDLRLTVVDAEGHVVGTSVIERPGVVVRDGRFELGFDPGVLYAATSSLAVRAELRGADGRYAAVGHPTPLVPAPAAATGCWELAGNAATDPAANYLGTRDAAAFELRVLGTPALRLSPSEVLFGGAPNTSSVRAGSAANQVRGDVRGGAVRGGGSLSGDVDPALVVDEHRLRAHYSVIGGGATSEVGATNAGPMNSSFSVVTGGVDHTVSGSGSRVGGGQDHRIDGGESTIGGGFQLAVVGNRSAVLGGSQSTASFDNSAVGGGYRNWARSASSAIGGGRFNQTVGAWSAVGGGFGQHAPGVHGATSGGRGSCAGGDTSWSGGNQGKIRHGSGATQTPCPGGVLSGDADGDEGTFMWSDAFDADLLSTGPNQFLVRAAGGLWFGTAGPIAIPNGTFLATSTGASLTTGGTWTNASSRALKHAFEPVDADAVLERVLALPLSTWRYLADAEGTRHLGPIAEDFHAAFGLGADPRSIATVDADGVALAAVQGLAAKAAAGRADFDRRLEQLTLRLCATGGSHDVCRTLAGHSSD